jgi:hypothetical protein
MTCQLLRKTETFTMFNTGTTVYANFLQFNFINDSQDNSWNCLFSSIDPISKHMKINNTMGYPNYLGL